MPGSASVVRAAVIGFGRIAEAHYVPALRALPNVRIVAVADPLKTRQDAAGIAFPDAKLFADADSLFAAQAVDAVLIASPPSMHFPAVDTALQRDVAVFVEKPFVGPGQIARLERLPRADRLMINFNRRFWPPYQNLRTLVADPKRTDPVRIRIVMQVDPRRWNSITRFSERCGEARVLYDLGSHAVDLAVFISAEEPIAIRARSTAPDACSLLLRFRDGSRATCFVRYGTRGVERIEVRSNRGAFTSLHPMIGLRAGNDGLHSAAASARDFKALAAHLWAGRFSMIRFTVAAALEHFFTSLHQRISPVPGFPVALQNALCLEGALKSVGQRRSVGIEDL